MKTKKTQTGLQKLTSVVLTVIIASVAIIGASYAFRGYLNNSFVDQEKNVDLKEEESSEADRKIGGERDEHGCLGPAGYTWCEAKEKCLREWEEPCGQEEAFNLLTELKTATKISFSGINKRELSWQTEGGEEKASGRGFDATDLSDEQYRSIESFFKTKGFKADLYNVAAGTISESTGYRKGDMSCTVTGGALGYQEATGQWIPPALDKKEVEVICATLKIDETANWQTYENEKYSYSLKYPKDCLNGPLPGECKQSPPEKRAKECLCFLNSTDPDSVMMQTFTGPKSELSGASLIISHSPNPDFNPPADADLITWLKEKFPYLEIPDVFNTEIDGVAAVKAYTPQSPQAYSSENIFFLHNGQLLQIYMIDVDNDDNRALYDKLLSTLKLN